MVLSTWRRKGVFEQTEGQATAGRWRQIQGALRIAFEKVSLVPDHVHLAVRIHPSVWGLGVGEDRVHLAVRIHPSVWGLGVGEDRVLCTTLGERDGLARSVTTPGQARGIAIPV